MQEEFDDSPTQEQLDHWAKQDEERDEFYEKPKTDFQEKQQKAIDKDGVCFGEDEFAKAFNEKYQGNPKARINRHGFDQINDPIEDKNAWYGLTQRFRCMPDFLAIIEGNRVPIFWVEAKCFASNKSFYIKERNLKAYLEWQDFTGVPVTLWICERNKDDSRGRAWWIGLDELQKKIDQLGGLEAIRAGIYDNNPDKGFFELYSTTMDVLTRLTRERFRN